MPRQGCPYGSHRSLDPAGSLPQAAWRLDNSAELWDNELLIDVRTLNVDAASFTQISRSTGGSEEATGLSICEIVAQRGKLHNPVTGSGGMLVGTVAAIGERYAEQAQASGRPVPKIGQPIATLVSLSLTPLRIDSITGVRSDRDQVDIRGQAVLFETGLWAAIPEDMPETLVLAALDVCGAPAQTAELVKAGDRVLIIGGGGKSGLFCLYEAIRRAGPQGQVVALDYSPESVRRAERLAAATTGASATAVRADATRPLEVERIARELTGGRKFDVTINAVNVPGTEMASILATRPEGLVYFFSMATSFTAAALGAEGVGSPVRMMIGNGYTPGHADLTLQALRESAALRQMFEEVYA